MTLNSLTYYFCAGAGSKLFDLFELTIERGEKGPRRASGTWNGWTRERKGRRVGMEAKGYLTSSADCVLSGAALDTAVSSEVESIRDTKEG